MDLCLILAFFPTAEIVLFLDQLLRNDFPQCFAFFFSFGNCTSALGICSISFMNTEARN